MNAQRFKLPIALILFVGYSIQKAQSVVYYGVSGCYSIAVGVSSRKSSYLYIRPKFS